MKEFINYKIITIEEIKEEELNKLELTKEQEIKSRKKESYVAYYLLNEMLKEYNLSLKDLTYKEDKPLLPNIYVSISHKDNYIACVISSNEVGIDIERVKPVPKEISNQFFTPEEQEYIENSNLNLNSFFELYTIKECLSKIDGRGLKAFPEINIIKDNKVYLPEYKIKHEYIDKYILTIVTKN